MGIHQAIIIGAGQAGLATAYYLRKWGVDTLLLDAHVRPGGSWNQVWDSLTLFSTAEFSSLPGMQMRSGGGELHPADVREYFAAYEQRYGFDIRRPVLVDKVTDEGGHFRITTDGETFRATHVVMATGTQSRPFVPQIPGSVSCQHWHTANYPGAETFRGTKVAVVGAGNSGAQLAAELSEVADVTWLVRSAPKFMPDDIDGTELFRRSKRRALQELHGEEITEPSVGELGDIIVTDSIRRAREEGRLTWSDVPDSLDDLDVDHLIWATGYRPALRPVSELLDDSRQPTVQNLHLVGYGDWTGAGSATITGVGPFARQVAESIASNYRPSSAQS